MVWAVWRKWLLGQPIAPSTDSFLFTPILSIKSSKSFWFGWFYRYTGWRRLCDSVGWNWSFSISTDNVRLSNVHTGIKHRLVLVVHLDCNLIIWNDLLSLLQWSLWFYIYFIMIFHPWFTKADANTLNMWRLALILLLVLDKRIP
jgi:hypothetical protein